MQVGTRGGKGTGRGRGMEGWRKGTAGEGREGGREGEVSRISSQEFRSNTVGRLTIEPRPSTTRRASSTRLGPPTPPRLPHRRLKPLALYSPPPPFTTQITKISRVLMFHSLESNLAVPRGIELLDRRSDVLCAQVRPHRHHQVLQKQKQ